MSIQIANDQVDPDRDVAVQPPRKGRVRILIVDDHPVFREGLAGLINSQPDFELVDTASNGADAVDRHQKLQPDVTLLDLRLPDIGGLDVLKAIRSVERDARVIILTTYLGDVQAKLAMEAGASGYLLKSSHPASLLDAIRVVHLGGKHLPADVAEVLAQHMADDLLSSREIEVLRLVATGSSNKLIAARLFISEDTVKGHIRNILAKLGANDRTHAVTISLKRGFLEI